MYLPILLQGGFKKNQVLTIKSEQFFSDDQPGVNPVGLRFAMGSANNPFWLTGFAGYNGNGISFEGINYFDDKWHSFTATFDPFPV